MKINVSKPAVLVASFGCMLAFQACSTSGTGQVGTQIGPVKADVEVTWQPTQKGVLVGTYKDGTTGKEYELYDIDGDGTPDFAKEKGTNKWYKIISITLAPAFPEPSVNIQSRDNPDRAAGKTSSLPIFDVEGGTLELTPSILGSSAYMSDHNGAVHVSVTFNPDMISQSISFGSESDLAASVFDFNGFTEAEILEQYGWVDSGDDNYEIHAYSNLVADGNTDQDELHAFFVFASGVEMPDFNEFDLKYSIVPGNEWDDEFTCYGIAVSGDIYAISAFASAVGVTELTITQSSTGLSLVTTLDAQTNSASSTILGVPYDSYSY